MDYTARYQSSLVLASILCSGVGSVSSPGQKKSLNMDCERESRRTGDAVIDRLLEAHYIGYCARHHSTIRHA